MRAEDLRILGTSPEGKPVVLVINKIDRVKDKSALLPVLAAYVEGRRVRGDGPGQRAARVRRARRWSPR